MKILIFMQALKGGGAERTIINIINNISRDIFEVVLVIGNSEVNDYSSYMEKDVRVITLDSKRLRYSFFKLRKVIVDENPDLLFTTMNQYNIFISLVNTTIFNRPKLVLRESNNRSQSKKISILNRLLTRISYNILSDGIVALSLGVKEDLINNFGIKDKNIRVIYNPIDLKSIKELKFENVNDFEKKEDNKNLIAVGRLVKQKDYPTLFKAIRILKKKYSVNLLVLGTGVLKNELQKMVIDLGIQDEVIFKGFVKNPYKYMFNSDLFILSSRWEGFGHVIVEAMASEVPVIATDCKSGPSEIITDKKNGRLVTVGDFLELSEVIEELLLKDTEKYIYEGIKRAEFFDAEKITKEYQKYFLETLDRFGDNE